MTDMEMTRLCAEAMGVEIFNPQELEPAYQIKDHAEDANWYAPLHDDAQAMALLCWLVRYNENERLEISNHVFFYQHRAFRYTQLGDFSKPDHLRRAIVQCAAKMQLEKQK